MDEQEKRRAERLARLLKNVPQQRAVKRWVNRRDGTGFEVTEYETVECVTINTTKGLREVPLDSLEPGERAYYEGMRPNERPRPYTGPKPIPLHRPRATD